MSFLNRLLGREKYKGKTPADMSIAAGEKIIQDYGATLETGPNPGCVADVSNLPHSKEHIKQAITLVFSLIKEPQMKEYLKFAYLSLANWQKGVGVETIGFDFTKMDQSADPLEMAQKIASQGDDMKKWTPLIGAEEDMLKSELNKLE